jgi:hypothetical protein
VWGVSVLVLICIVFYLFDASRADVAEPLQVGGSKLNLGTMWAQNEYRWQLPVTNTSDARIEVIDVMTSCTCLSLAPQSFSLAPRETRQLDLVLDLLSRRDSSAYSSFWPYEVELIPVIKDQRLPPSSWSLRGTVRALLPGLPSEIDFGTTCVAGFEYPSRNLHFQTAIPLQDLTVRSSNESVVHVKSIRRLDEGERSFSITLIPSPMMCLGDFVASVFVEALPEGEHIPVVELNRSALVF